MKVFTHFAVVLTLTMLWGNVRTLAQQGADRSSPARARTQPVSARQASLDEYEVIKANYPDSAEGQWELAEWCRKNRLSSQRQTHLERVIALEPDHAAARRALGYQKQGGEWVTQEQIMTERGYVRYKGRWVLPQEVKQIEEKRKNTAAENQWVSTLKKWREMLGDERSNEAIANIQSINDPFAIRAIESQLKEEPSDQVRALYLKALARIDNAESVRLLVRASLHDTSEEVRLTAIDYLAEKKYPEVVALYIQSLRSKENVEINRAAVGLAAMENPAAIPALVDALVTMHTEVVTVGSPGISSTFARPGGKNSAPTLNGFSTGQSTYEVTRALQNHGVLDALIKLTGVNYDFDVANWKAWLASRKKGDSLDQRRG
jgi:hypothetical protein